MPTIKVIKQLLDPYDNTQTECDGMTRICHTLLSNCDITHQPMAGRLSLHNRCIEPHFWIDLPSGNRVDYRARMWLGAHAPHGVFKPQNFPDTIYKGQPINLDVLSPLLFEILTFKVSGRPVLAILGL